MYQWQMASNKDRFGDWFIMEIGSKEPNYNLTSHIYLEQPVTINRSVNVLMMSGRIQVFMWDVCQKKA